MLETGNPLLKTKIKLNLIFIPSSGKIRTEVNLLMMFGLEAGNIGTEQEFLDLS